MRSFVLALGVTIVLMLGGCGSYQSKTAGGVVSGSSEQLKPLESDVGAPMSVAPDWRVRDQSTRSLWLISQAADSELILTREATARRDYASRADSEAELLRSQQITVSGPVTTQLFGQPAAALSSSGPEYSRIIIASRDWSVRVHRQGPFDAKWARTVSGMLSRGGQGPEIPSLE